MLDEIRDIITSRSKKTNCFCFFNEICKWDDDKKADFYLISNNVFIFLKANGFYKFYYYVDEFNDIALAKSILEKYNKNSKISLEFTTKNGRFVEDVRTAIEPIGFEFYAEFIRFITSKNRLLNIEEYDFSKILQLATYDDIDEILDIFYKEFDPIKDDLATREELQMLIDKGAVVIKKIENRIIYIQIYELSKETLYSRITWIKREFRKPKYTIQFYSAFHSYLKQLIGNGKLRFYSWVNKDVKNYKILIKNDNKPDGLTSTIFVYKNSQME